MPVSDALAFITAVVSLMIYIKKVSKQHPVVAE
jgi:MATE efflux family protein